MSDQQMPPAQQPDPWGGPTAYYPPQPPQPPRNRRRIRNTLIVLAALGVVGAIASGVSSSSGHKSAVNTTTSATAAAAATSSSAAAAADTTSSAAPAVPPPVSLPPVPDPKGTVTGTCDYELADNYSDAHAGDLDAEATVSNTGNIGAGVKVTVKFPQLGHAPIVLSKTVRVNTAGQVTAEFTRPATGNEIDRLQSWQTGHEGDDMCTYNGTITSTFGKVQG